MSDGFVATPFMGARVGGTSAVTNGMSMVSERASEREREIWGGKNMRAIHVNARKKKTSTFALTTSPHDNIPHQRMAT